LAVSCDTQKAGNFYTDAQNLHRTDKRLVLKEVAIRAYEYSDTYPDFGGTESLKSHIIWPKVGYIDSRWDFGPFTGCDSFYRTCTYVILFAAQEFHRLLYCVQCLCLSGYIGLQFFLLLTKLLYCSITRLQDLCFDIDGILELFLVFTQLVYRLFETYVGTCSGRRRLAVHVEEEKKTLYVTRDSNLYFASRTVHFVTISVKNQQMRQLFIQLINYVW
jgi:hypothetical protein